MPHRLKLVFVVLLLGHILGDDHLRLTVGHRLAVISLHPAAAGLEYPGVGIGDVGLGLGFYYFLGSFGFAAPLLLAALGFLKAAPVNLFGLSLFGLALLLLQPEAGFF